MTTMRDFLTAVVSANVSEEVTAYATNELAKMDKKNADRRAKPSKASVANEPIKAALLALLTDGKVHVASEMATAVSTAEVNVTTQKVSAILKALVEDGTVITFEVRVKGKGKVKGYALPSAEEDETEDETESE